VEMILKGGFEHGFTIKFGEKRIRTKDKVKYLGIIINQDMVFKTQPETIAQKARLNSVE